MQTHAIKQLHNKFRSWKREWMNYFVFGAEADAEVDDQLQKDDSAAAAESRHTQLQIEPQRTLNCKLSSQII